MSRSYWVYIMTHRPGGTLYISVTGHLQRRVYFKDITDVHTALARKQQLKGWTRVRKVELIEGANPGGQGLYNKISG